MNKKISKLTAFKSNKLKMAKGTLKESDARSQYRCGWVGRGIQPPSTPQPYLDVRTKNAGIALVRR